MAKLRALKPRVAMLGNRIAIMVPGSWRSDKQSSSRRGYTYAWQQARERFLRDHPLCQCPNCDEGRIRALRATVVDHRVPHRGDMTLFWDQSNWWALAKACHDGWKAQEEARLGQRG